MMHQMKFVLWKKAEQHGTYELEFQSQYDTSIPEDKQFNEFTPMGTVRLTVKPSVAEQYEVGKHYYFYSDKAE